MRTQQKHQHSSSEHDVLKLEAPTSWSSLSEDQLRYVLSMMATHPSTEVKVLMLLRFCGLRVIEKTAEGHKVMHEDRVLYLQTWQVRELIHTFDYIDGYEDYTVRLDAQCGLHPVDVLLHGVPFVVYLQLEKYYQGFLCNKENTSLLEKMAQYLYNDEKQEKTFSEAERLHCFLWYSWVKKEFGRYFPHFFKPSMPGAKSTELSIIEQMNTQIRALTGGDITKEETIFNMDCWRALTELDAKARDAAELKKKK